MSPSKKRSADQRTLLSLMLIGDVLFGVHFENDFVRSLQMCRQLLEAFGAWSLFSFASR